MLQKGGIKTNRLFNLQQDNQYIVELFLNRKPDQKIDYTTAIGVKDMMRIGTDFVSKSLTKRLSMEFDWKRKPKNVSDRSVEFAGHSYVHLSFETDPLEDFEEFLAVRKAWGDYDNKPRHNLKLSADLTDFETFRVTRRKVNREVGRYLPRKNGAMKRLRRDLTRAFKHQQAGFELVMDRRPKITHAEFANALVSCGIPCTVDDVDNGKRQPFKVHQCVDMLDVKAAIEMLKAEHFPELETELFFSLDDT